MILFIDSSQSYGVYLALVDKSGEVAGFFRRGARRGELFDLEKELLAEVDHLFNSKGVLRYGNTTLDGVIVVSGPGRFTSLRLGVTLADVLGFAKDIPVVGVQKINNDNVQYDRGSLIRDGLQKLKNIVDFCPVLPEYRKEPNITGSSQ